MSRTTDQRARRGLRRRLRPGAVRRPDPACRRGRAYSRLWERLAATVLSLYVLAVLVGIGRGRRARRRLLLGLSRVSDLAALDAITEAVESGAGLPEVVRAAARALEASLAVTDAWGATLAVAARSPAEERSLLGAGRGRHQRRRCASPTPSSARCTCARKTEPSAVDAAAAA